MKCGVAISSAAIVCEYLRDIPFRRDLMKTVFDPVHTMHKNSWLLLKCIYVGMQKKSVLQTSGISYAVAILYIIVFKSPCLECKSHGSWRQIWFSVQYNVYIHI